ncbi:hypothetical protein EV175_001446, partial [Coemansia sp. RSA 1933]
AHNLRLIAATLGKEKQSFLYPIAIFSGNVKFWNGKEYIKDDTSKIFEHNEDEEKLAREHNRILVTPVGDYLDTVEKEEELVLVLADAMECHNAILTKCRLLHRDISVNNILVVRKFEGKSVRRPVKGLLIDFDHAISIDQQSSGYATRSGTLPFMSIHNLEGHESQRTALDDWESLLYVICWLGTYGINHADNRHIKKDEADEISKWRTGSMTAIAKSKRIQMDSLRNFRLTILAGFQDRYELLKILADAIYEALFQHKGCKGAHIPTQRKSGNPFESDIAGGSLPSEQYFAKQSDRDPLVLRKENEKDIIRTLLTTTQNASQRAQRNLEARAANEGNTSAPAYLELSTPKTLTMRNWASAMVVTSRNRLASEGMENPASSSLRQISGNHIKYH